MNRKLFYVSIFFISNLLNATDIKNKYVIDIYFTPTTLGIVTYNLITNKNVYFTSEKSDLKTSEVMEETFLKRFDLKELPLKKIDPHQKTPSHKYQSNEGDVSYELTNCKGYSKTQEMWDGVCSGMSLIISNKKYIIKDSLEAYIHYLDPVIWKDKILMKRYLEPSQSDSSGYFPGGILAFLAIDLKTSKVIDKTKMGHSSFANTWTTMMKKDSNEKYIWIGNNYGVYALDENLDEKITCFFVPVEYEKTLGSLRCIKAEYVEDYKKDQTKLIIEKMKNEKANKAIPLDVSKKMLLRAELMKKLENSGKTKEQKAVELKEGFRLIDETMKTEDNIEK